MVADKYEKKIEAATLPPKTKEQLRKYIGEKPITDAQFKEILDRVNKEYLSPESRHARLSVSLQRSPSGSPVRR